MLKWSKGVVNWILKLQLFNKDQREGLAKVADNLATATIVATVVGGFIDNKIDILKGFTLITIENYS